jgi:hypothetical protein
MIINVRGTHGSGKSHLVRSIMSAFPCEPLAGVKRPDGYRVEVTHLNRPLYVVGSYETACGGCDGIQPYSLIWPRVVEYAGLGHVLFEGALVSSSYGNIGRDSQVYGDDFVFAFLDTPLAVCLERIAARRRARGDARPLDPKNTEYKYNNILKSIPKIRDEFKRRVVVLGYNRAVPQLLGVLRRG